MFFSRSIFWIGDNFNGRNGLFLTWTLWGFRLYRWRFLYYRLSLWYLVLHGWRFNARSRIGIDIGISWRLGLVIFWITDSFSFFMSNLKDLFSALKFKIMNIACFRRIWAFGIFSFGQWLSPWNNRCLCRKNIWFLAVGILSCWLGTLNIWFDFIYLSWTIDYLMIINFAWVAVFASYWNQILRFSRLWFCGGFLSFRRRGFFRRVYKMFILLVMRKRSSSFWASHRTFSWRSRLAILTAAVLWSHFSIMTPPSCEFLLRIKCSFPTSIRDITLR